MRRTQAAAPTAVYELPASGRLSAEESSGSRGEIETKIATQLARLARRQAALGGGA